MTNGQDVPVAIPWYKSRILQMLLLAGVTKGVGYFHLPLDEATQAQIVGWIIEGLGWGSLIYAGYSRTKHPTPQITANKAQAVAINTAAADSSVSIPAMAILTNSDANIP